MKLFKKISIGWVFNEGGRLLTLSYFRSWPKGKRFRLWMGYKRFKREFIF